MVVVNVKANEPDANAVHGRIFVERARRRRASLSVSSTTKMVTKIVRKSASRLDKKPENTNLRFETF